MGIGDYFFLFLILLSFSLQVRVLNSQNVSCNPNDLLALENFMKGLETRIDTWVLNSNGSSDCCKWEGVFCKDSRVTGLEIVNRKLKGSISESLGDLDQLSSLNLSQNLLNGSLPVKIFHLQKLEVLNLSYNELTEVIPTEMNLPSLQTLDISQNYFSGSIPVGICVNSTRIRVLNFSTNNLVGSFPAGFGNCGSLERLAVNSNNLSESLPMDLFSLKNLSHLHLQDNKFSGWLNKEIGNLTNLVQLDISVNRFSHLVPDVFGSLRKLERVMLQSNTFNGSIPSSLSNSPSVKVLSVRNNSMSGSISFNCSAMVSLTSLDLGSNRFKGPFPDLSLCRGMQAINFARNNLSSELPESFKKLQSLSYLSLTQIGLRNITGALTILQECKSLTTLVLTVNFDGEEMPVELNGQFENLTALVMPNCNLTGSIPQWLRRSSKLQLLDLSWNHLKGTIPDWFGSMKSLFYLDVSNNNFSGEIPSSLTKLESMIYGNVTLKEPSPDFPFFYKRNQSIRGFQYNQIVSFPSSLDLSDNSLTGPIPPEFGNLKKLYVLNLGLNRLSGSIPPELSNMTGLVSLDLSNNTLSGTIPSSLVSLYFLSKFSVAYNQLSGEIPTGGQFLTFPNASFEGNVNLCGVGRAKLCEESRTPTSPPSHSRHKARSNKATVIGVAVGVGSGTTILLILLFFIVTRIRSKKQVEAEKDDDDFYYKDMEMSGSRSVVLFEFEDSSKELFIEDLLKSTDNFDQSNIVGCGGFGLVYKATLPDGRKVAIKRLSGDCGQVDREFQAEVETLSKAQHKNLVLLQGYCSWKSDRLLIYTYMENGSLDYWLHEKLDGSYSLDWPTRLRIAQGAANGLAYLHLACEPHILHRDVKSSNILLDEDFEAHLADFGLARLIETNDTHVSTDLVGTLGYIPPEYGHASVATFKGDIYSFGVVLLELITGKRPMDMCKPKDRRNLISWVLEMKKEKREAEVIDPFIYDKEHDKEILRMLEIACFCLHESPKARPSTQQIVTWLDSISTMAIDKEKVDNREIDKEKVDNRENVDSS